MEGAASLTALMPENPHSQVEQAKSGKLYKAREVQKAREPHSLQRRGGRKK